ncbi:MAG: ECF transporter S component [Nocardioidaceae bacterium]|nr:ECF transporter S component [Nocardioidaceae bacterium]
MNSTRITSPLLRPHGSPARWRTIELLTAAIIGVVFGVAYWGYSSTYTALPGLKALTGPFVGLVNGPWLIAGVISGLVIRRVGAAFFAEVLAAVVSTQLGTEWGWTTVISGVVQGAGAELAFAIFLFRRFTWPVAALSGALAAVGGFCYEWFTWLPGFDLEYKLGYLGAFVISGALVAGIGGWVLTAALARTGAIDALPAGQEAARHNAV